MEEWPTGSSRMVRVMRVQGGVGAGRQMEGVSAAVLFYFLLEVIIFEGRGG
ncbi:MAG: hypothetical protein GX334_08260 [Firmicutes bacterium]|nr:hypothetical protein [Bacillota bacterium]